jgi:glycosyltransferase involved in cell wall biosynthesis
MPDRPLVSCVVPVFNGARYLEEAVASIEAQTWGPIEIVVVDDGSTDATPETIARLGSRIRAVRQDNAGAPAARNRGIAEASGDLLSFLDADDLWLPEKIATQMACFAARPWLDLCVCGTEHWWIPELADEASAIAPALNREARTGGFPTVLARRDLFARTGPIDASLRHLDMAEWLMRVADVGGVVETLSDPLVRRRIHHDNASRRRGEGEARDRLRIAELRLAARRARGG